MIPEPKPRADRVRATVTVGFSPDEAFRIFTEDVNLWWRRGPRFRSVTGETGILYIEPGEGGRIFETSGVAGDQYVVVRGRTTTWDPPHRLVIDWTVSGSASGEITRVEIRFEACSAGCRVSLEHSGWSPIPDGHPVRHALPDSEFNRSLGQWWASLLTALREHEERRGAHARVVSGGDPEGLPGAVGD